MEPQPTRLTHFKEAMQSVYGPFDHLPSSESKTWTPPPKSGGHRGRYLWTDAFGVLNFLTLYYRTSSPVYLTLPKSLVHSVHDILGRTRDGKFRLPGATDSEPLKGGLRIGKIDEKGSDGDGMYHHYLTLWMFALNRLSIASQEMEWNEMAVSLAKAIHPRFLREGTGGKKRMVWKISMDMERVLVPSEGYLDAATGFVVFKLLQERDGKEVLEQEVEDYKELMMRDGKLTASTDMLDLGMELWMCHFFTGEEWATELGKKCLVNASKSCIKLECGFADSTEGVLLEEKRGILDRSPQYRLAFREFGTCLGIGCYGGDEHLQARAAAVVKFWEEYMQEVTADDLRPITLVMYAAALIPGGELIFFHLRSFDVDHGIAFKKGFLGAEGDHSFI
jgi:hypothetical protein